MSYKYVVYEKRERIAYVTINRPEVMNALHPPAPETESAWLGLQHHVDRNWLRLALDGDWLHRPHVEDAAHVAIGVVRDENASHRRCLL